MNPLRLTLPVITVLCLLGTLACSVETPQAVPMPMKLVGKMEFAPISESSGIVRSRLWPDWIWTHNDSGDSARIFAVQKDGAVVKPATFPADYQGLAIGNAVNIDWEDITTDGNGNLFIAACGNNSNARRDLAIYKIPEPNATQVITTRSMHRYDFVYPDQTEFPPQTNNFDCEALFFAHGKLYLLTKHRADTFTKLYRFDDLDPIGINVPNLLGRFDIKGQVTAADASENGDKLAILTYDRVWLFKVKLNSEDYFGGDVFGAPLNKSLSKQCESLCFWDENTLLIGNEQRELYEIEISDLSRLQL